MRHKEKKRCSGSLLGVGVGVGVGDTSVDAETACWATRGTRQRHAHPKVVGTSVCYCLGGGTFSDGCVGSRVKASRSVELPSIGFDGKLRRVFGSRSVFASSSLGQRRCGGTQLRPPQWLSLSVSLTKWSLRRGQISMRCQLLETGVRIPRRHSKPQELPQLAPNLVTSSSPRTIPPHRPNKEKPLQNLD